jgi:hypothetical protein
MEKHITIAEAITDLLENRFTILNYRFGLDPLLGLIPGLGDALALIFSLYLVWIGIQMRLPGEKIEAMVRNILIDFFIGLIHFLGEVGDFVFKANSKNLKILRSHSPRIVEAGLVSA